MYDMYFFINYGGKGHKVAMTSEDMGQEQAENLTPVEGCITLIVPAGLLREKSHEELEALVS